jgi:hypothetical protein
LQIREFSILAARNGVKKDASSKVEYNKRRDLLEILEDRYGSRSTIVTSQVPIE